MVYLESSYDEERNEELKQNFRLFSVKTITITDNVGQFKYFGFYKALYDFLIAPPPVAPDLIFLGQDLRDGKHYVAFRFGEGRERKVKLMPKRYELYFQIALRTYCSRTKGLATSKVDRSVMSHLRSRLSEELKDISFVDQYKPEKTGNIYALRLDKSKVFVRTHKDDNHSEYIEIPIAKYKPK